VSVRELRQWIAEHVRFDVQHAAAAAPLDFGETAQRVEEAQAQPGRGKKVVPITFSHYCPDGAKTIRGAHLRRDRLEEGREQRRRADLRHAVLGLVVAGEQYGESFHVCIARDRCKTHWRESVEAKEKAAKLREKGETKQAAKVEKKGRKPEADASAKKATKKGKAAA
jgi:hypothetical protein